MMAFPAWRSRFLGRKARKYQTGDVQRYAFYLFGGVAIMALVIVLFAQRS